VNSAFNEVKEREQSIKQQLSDAKETKRNAEQSLSYLNNTTRNLQRDIGKIQADIQAMNSSSKENRNAVKFGNHVPELLTRIAQQSFQGPVVGPLGLHVTLRAGYEDYGYQVERVMGASINSLVVTTFDDRTRLERIIQSMNIRMTHRIIIQTPSPRYMGIPSIPRATSILDLINIENDLAFNTIVDQIRPENTVIVDDENDLRRNYLGTDSNRRECLRDNISRVVTRQGVFFSYRYGNQTAEEPEYGCRHLFASDASAVIQSLQQSLENKTHELMNIGNAIAEENANLHKLETHVREHERELRGVQTRLNEENRRRAEFQARLDELDAINNIDTSGLEREADEIKEANQQIDVQHDAKLLELESATIELNNRKQDRQSSERRKDELLADLERQETKLRNFINDSRASKDAVKRAEGVYHKKHQHLEEQLEIYRQLEAQYQTAADLARAKSQELIADYDGEAIPVNAKETVQTLERRVKTQTQDLQERREELMERMKNKSLETLQREYDRSQADLDQTRVSFEKFVQHLEDLEADYEVRQAKWKKKRNQSSNKVCQAFSRNLVGLGFSGKVEFLHKEKTLNLNVVPMGANAGGRAQDVRQISGGERSYVALSFLLALGTVVSSPPLLCW
jgi:structural maintenance of chromosomes protein 6